MILSIKKIRNIIGLILSIILLQACAKNTENPTKKEEKTATEATEEHAEEQIAELTDEQIKAVGILLAPIEERQLTATIKANGYLKVPNNSQANATSMFGGVVKALPIEIGNQVKKGQLIARIENPQFIQLQEEYLTVKNNIIFAEQELARQRELTDGGAGAFKNLQSIQTQINNLRARKASIEKQLQLMNIAAANIQPGNLQTSIQVLSPVSGTISAIFAKIGSYVDVASPVAEIVDNAKLHLDLLVFEKDLPKLKTGQTIYFTITNNPNLQYRATIFSIGASFENDSKTISVHSEVIGNKEGLINGMNAVGIISLDKAATPSVPNSAIVNADGKYYVFVVRDEAAKEHDHKANEKEATHEKGHKTTRFEEIEVFKGTSEAGYTAVTLLAKDVPPNAQVATNGAFFINAKLTNAGGHEH